MVSVVPPPPCRPPKFTVHGHPSKANELPPSTPVTPNPTRDPKMVEVVAVVMWSSTRSLKLEENITRAQIAEQIRRYMAPELRAGVGASAKADVYSYGVLMMEMVTSRRPSWPVKINMKGKEVEMLKWARDKVEAGQMLEILDRQMGIQGEGKETDQDEMSAYLDVARRCTEESPKHRPSMEVVVEMLNKI